MLPTEFQNVMIVFRSFFSKNVFKHLEVLFAGAILSVKKRTISSALQAVGLGHCQRFHKYHRVFSHAKWDALKCSRALLLLLLKSFTRSGPLVFAIDETIERRWGAQIKARGIYRDAVRSSKKHLVKTSGLRWMSLAYLVKIPWADRVWALPFMTVLAPSERYFTNYCEGGHKKITDWARQMLLCLRRWLADQ